MTGQVLWCKARMGGLADLGRLRKAKRGGQPFPLKVILPLGMVVFEIWNGRGMVILMGQGNTTVPSKQALAL